MKRVNMRDAKARLSRYLAELKPGETLVICKRNQPVAEVRSLVRQRRKVRFGVAKGEFTVPNSFFQPLPDDLLMVFNGE